MLCILWISILIVCMLPMVRVVTMMCMVCVVWMYSRLLVNCCTTHRVVWVV